MCKFSIIYWISHFGFYDFQKFSPIDPKLINIIVRIQKRICKTEGLTIKTLHFVQFAYQRLVANEQLLKVVAPLNKTPF